MALVVGVLGGLLASVEAAATQAVRHDPALLAGAGGAYALETRLGPDADAQDATVRDAVDDLGASLVVTRALRSEPRPLTGGDDEAAGGEGDADGAQPSRIVVGYEPAPAEHAELLEGAWPSEPGQGALHAGAAELLGVAPGQVLELAQMPVEISGLWLPARADDPFWAVDPLAATGATDRAAGPLLVDEQTLVELQSDPVVRWTLVPEPGALTAESMAGLAHGLDRLPAVIDATPAVVRGLVTTGELPATATASAQQVDTTRSVVLVPLSLVAVASFAAVVQVGRLLVRVRRRETRILVARGISPRQLALLAAGEGAAVGVAGALLGVAGATAALAVAGLLGTVGGRGTAMLALVGVGGVLGVVAVLAVAAGVDARSVARAPGAGVSGRARAAVGASAALVLTLAAGLGAWQIWLARDGAEEPDPVVMAAPAVVLLALVLLALALWAPLLRLAERAGRASRGLDTWLTRRQVGRRLLAYSVPVALLALASAVPLVAAGYAGTTAGTTRHVETLRVGADLRVTTPDAGRVTERTALRAGDLPQAGQTEESLVLTGAARIGDVGTTLVALPAEHAGLLRGPGSREVAQALRGAGAGSDTLAAGVPIPPGTSAVRLEVVGRSGASAAQALWIDGDLPDVGPQRVGVGAWLAADDGALRRADAGEVAFPVADSLADADLTATELELEVPDGEGWRIVGLDLSMTALEVSTDNEVAVRIAGGPDDLTPSSWRATSTQVDAVPIDDEPLSVAVAIGWGQTGGASAGPVVRLAPAATLAEDGTPVPVPAVLTAALAERLDLRVGDRTTLTINGVSVPVAVVGRLGAVPGTLDELAVVADLGALHAAQIAVGAAASAPGEIWATAPDPASAAATLAVTLPTGWAVTRPSTELSTATGTLVATFRVAATGVLVLALVGSWSVLAAMARERRSEVVALRAVGVSGRRQAWQRMRELGIVAASAIVIGAGTGAGVAAAVGPLLARATVTSAPAGLPLPLAFDVGLLAWASVALAGGVAALAVGCSALVRSQARDLGYREEAR